MTHQIRDIHTVTEYWEVGPPALTLGGESGAMVTIYSGADSTPEVELVWSSREELVEWIERLSDLAALAEPDPSGTVPGLVSWTIDPGDLPEWVEDEVDLQ